MGHFDALPAAVAEPAAAETVAGRPFAEDASRQDFIQLMIDGLAPKLTHFTVEQHGAAWQLSQSEQAKASAAIYTVLQGACYVHLQSGQSFLLQTGETVLLLADSPYQLSTSADAQHSVWPTTEHSLAADADKALGSVTLARAYFEFAGALSATLLASFPEVVRLSHRQANSQAVTSVLDLLSAEFSEASERTPLLEHLTQLLFFYLIRNSLSHFDCSHGLCALICHPRFSGLIQRILESPADAWRVSDMAAYLHMSRASFYKYFMAISDFPPAQLLQQLRIQLAMQLLRCGKNMGQVAETVGFQSQATFSRVFMRLVGVQPSVWQQQLKGV